MEFYEQDLRALQDIDLRLSFGVHGLQTAIPRHGYAVLDVRDQDYTYAARFVTQLDSDRGDTVAQEGCGYSDDWTPNSFVSGLSGYVGDSEYLSDEDRLTLQLMVGDTHSADADYQRATPNERQRLWHNLRKLRLYTPVDYAACLAMENGIAVHYADADEDALEDWQFVCEQRYNETRGRISQLRQRLTYSRDELRFRDHCTVARLAQLAGDMKLRNDGHPTIAYLGGIAHRRGIESRLRQLGVDFTSHEYSPDHRSRKLFRIARGVGHLALPPLVKSLPDTYDERWIENARVHSAAYRIASGSR